MTDKLVVYQILDISYSSAVESFLIEIKRTFAIRFSPDTDLYLQSCSYTPKGLWMKGTLALSPWDLSWHTSPSPIPRYFNSTLIN